jgi:hypothetical protein
LDLQPVFEPGEIEILVGPCADRLRLLVQNIRLYVDEGGAMSSL